MFNKDAFSVEDMVEQTASFAMATIVDGKSPPCVVAPADTGTRQMLGTQDHMGAHSANVATDKERAENSLAKKISMQWTTLGDATKAELARLQKETKAIPRARKHRKINKSLRSSVA